MLVSPHPHPTPASCFFREGPRWTPVQLVAQSIFRVLTSGLFLKQGEELCIMKRAGHGIAGHGIGLPTTDCQNCEISSRETFAPLASPRLYPFPPLACLQFPWKFQFLGVHCLNSLVATRRAQGFPWNPANIVTSPAFSFPSLFSDHRRIISISGFMRTFY